MNMRVNTLVTHLRPEEAITLVEFLDQLREVLMQTYGVEIRAMLQEATTCEPGSATGDDAAF